MRLSALTICGFRCFGPEPVAIDLSELTAFIGANAAGKTTVLCALQRLFGGTHQAYVNVFTRCGLDFTVVEAEAGPVFTRLTL